MATTDHRSDRSRTSCSCDEALAIVLSRIGEPACQLLPLAEVFGLTCAAPVPAVEPSPIFDTSAMDGFAVRSADTIGASELSPISLSVVGAVPAGQNAPALHQVAACIRVMTGAPVPNGADAVIPFELVREAGDRIAVMSTTRSGSNIRVAGEDIRPGDILIGQGEALGPAQIALLASQGIEHVYTYPTPRISIFVTGDELAQGVAIPEGAAIRDSNSLMMTTLVRAMGANVVTSSRQGDDPTRLIAAIRDSIRQGVDLILTVGGASVGDRDVVSDLVSVGVNLVLMDVRMKPGRPLICGQIDGVPLIGLPGNPAAAYVSAVQFVMPVISKLRGARNPVWSESLATVTTTINNPGGRRNFVRVCLDRVDGILMATPAGPQNAANLLTLARADGLLIVPELMDLVNPGDELTVQLLPGRPPGTDALLARV